MSGTGRHSVISLFIENMKESGQKNDGKQVCRTEPCVLPGEFSEKVCWTGTSHKPTALQPLVHALDSSALGKPPDLPQEGVKLKA